VAQHQCGNFVPGIAKTEIVPARLSFKARPLERQTPTQKTRWICYFDSWRSPSRWKRLLSCEVPYSPFSVVMTKDGYGYDGDLSTVSQISNQRRFKTAKAD
jgi:hypothetical protein